MKKHKPDYDLVLGLMFTILILLIAIIGLVHTPFDPYAMNAAQRFQPPSLSHFFGTDSFGRDNLSRIMYGVRYTLLVAAGTVGIGAACGTFLGLVSGYTGGIADEVIMRFMDALTSVPSILLALVMVTVLRQGRFTIIAALGIAFIPSFTRIVRAETLRIRGLDYIRQARVFGAGRFRIMFAHILPNVAPSLLSAVVVGFSNAILVESGMSYLGLGIQPPVPSLGRMLSEAQSYLFIAPYCAIAPGLVIITAVMGFNFLGEYIRKKF